MSKDRNVVGALDVSELEARFLAQLLEQVNPQGIQGTEVKLSLMKKVDVIVKSLDSGQEEQ